MNSEDKFWTAFWAMTFPFVLGMFTIMALTVPSCHHINTCLEAETKNPVLCELVLQNKYPVTERMTDEKFAR